MNTEDAIDRLIFVNGEGRKYLRQLAQELASGRVVLFAGAGLSFNAVCRDGGPNLMPSWAGLAAKLRARLDDDINAGTDPLKVADLFETKFGRAALVEAIREAIQDQDYEPDRVHGRIALLDFEEIITTNFDTLIERAFRNQFVEPQVIVRGQDLVERRRPPRIIKMNGCIRLNPSEIVITGNDFLSYSDKHPWAQVFVTKSFVESTVLFLGFGLTDPAFQAINERVLSMLGRDNPRLAFSLQHGVSRTEMEFWKRRQVQIIHLRSGEPCALNDEERLYRVLDALLEVQRGRAFQERKPISLLTDDQVSTDGKKELEAQRSLVQKILMTIGLRLGEATINEIVADRNQRLSGLYSVFRECLKRFAAREHRAPRCEEALEELSAWLKSICRLEDLESPGIRLDPKDWRALRSLADLLIDVRIADVESLRGRDLGWNLRVLTALLSLKLLVLVPRFADEWKEETLEAEKQLAFKRFLAALEGLDLTCLATEDMQIRSRLVLLLCFFGPVRRLWKMTDVWAGGRSEVELTGSTRKSRQATPVEYQLLPLSFHVVLSRRPEFFKKAAESLWSRHVFKDDPNGGWRIENAFRYRYLRQAAARQRAEREAAKREAAESEIGADEDWATARLHTDRLAHVLGQLALQVSGDPSSQDLLSVLLELNRGWIFGCPPPDALYHTWKSSQQKIEAVPWELLILFSLPILGEHLFDHWKDLLLEVWRAGYLDTGFLVDHTVVRLGQEGFGGFPEDWLVEQSPVGRYQAGLARMIEWLATRASFESLDNPLRHKLVVDLLPSLVIWLCETPYQEVRKSLLRSLATLREFAATEIGHAVQAWAVSRLGRSDQHSSLDLAELNPPQGTLAIRRDQIHMLLAQAQPPAAMGSDFRNDFLKWLVSWAEHEGSIDDFTLAALGGQIVDTITDSRRSSPTEWFALAAKVRVCPRLRAHIEDLLSRQRPDLDSPPLFGLVKRRLQDLSEENRRLLKEKGVLLAYFTPFVEDLDAFMSDFVEGSLISPKISPAMCDHAVHLLASLLSCAPDEISARYSKSWQTSLCRLLREGAVGSGLSREQLESLDEETRRALQSSLIVRLEREKQVKLKEIINQVVQMIRIGDSIPLADLEEGLVRGIQSPKEALALHSLKAVIALCRENPDFLDRNSNRIRLVREVVEALGNYRKPSRFAELLAELQSIQCPVPPVIVEQEPATPLPPKPPRNRRKK